MLFFNFHFDIWKLLCFYFCFLNLCFFIFNLNYHFVDFCFDFLFYIHFSFLMFFSNLRFFIFYFQFEIGTLWFFNCDFVNSFLFSILIFSFWCLLWFYFFVFIFFFFILFQNYDLSFFFKVCSFFVISSFVVDIAVSSSFASILSPRRPPPKWPPETPKSQF